MRALSIQETEQVSGGSYLGDIADLATDTGVIGSIIGYTATNTVAGATRGGWIGPSLGAAWGFGNAVGTIVYDRYVSRLILNNGY